MSYDRELAERIRDALGTRTWTSKQMFGGLAFMVDGHMTVAANRAGVLMVRIDPETGAGLLGPGVELMSMGGRQMPGWIEVQPAQIADDTALQEWVQRALDHVQTLPPKQAK